MAKLSGKKSIPVKIVSGNGPYDVVSPKPVVRNTSASEIVKKETKKQIKIYGELVIDPDTKKAHFERNVYDDRLGRSVTEKIPVSVGKKK